MFKAIKVFGFAASLSLMAVPVSAQNPIATGTQVKDTQGGEVGTIARVDGNFLIVRTDKHEVRLPTSSFTPHEGSLIIAVNRQQLNAEVEKALEAASAQLVAGATVSGSAGTPVGTIESIDDQFVTLKLTSGNLVKLPRSGIAAGPKGPVIGMTAAELEAAVGSSGS